MKCNITREWWRRGVGLVGTGTLSPRAQATQQASTCCSIPALDTDRPWMSNGTGHLTRCDSGHSQSSSLLLSFYRLSVAGRIEFLTGFEAALLHNSLRLLIMWWRPVQNTLVHTADVYFLTFQFFKSISNKARHHVLNIHKQNCLDYRISYTAWRIMTSCLATVCIPSHRSKTHFSVHVPW